MYLYYFEKRFRNKIKKKSNWSAQGDHAQVRGGSVATSGPCVEEAGISVLRPHLLQLSLLFLT